ncbi:MAG: hypothetical protein KDA81_12495, partial [Planctomycetaceae bacterium]|nr:hypothetical protein [Planctomycetaceae bacterium]
SVQALVSLSVQPDLQSRTGEVVSPNEVHDQHHIVATASDSENAGRAHAIVITDRSAYAANTNVKRLLNEAAGDALVLPTDEELILLDKILSGPEFGL